MGGQEGQAWYHADVNSAYLNWTTTYRVCILGGNLDLRDIPSVIGGSEAEWHGIVLVKSGSAKKYGIRTGEALAEARCKCPGLVIIPPDYSLYVGCSKALMELLKKYLPHVHQYSIDGAFCRVEGAKRLWGTRTAFVHRLKEEIRRELGFTVNISVSDCKLLIKMVSEFQKPDQVHALFTREIEKKMWSLPINDPFWAGPATVRKLGALRIKTIGELAATGLGLLKRHLKKQGELIWDHVNGRDVSPFLRELLRNKGYGSSMITPSDVTDRETAWQAVLSLTEIVYVRFWADGMETACVGIPVTNREFRYGSIQTTLISTMDTILKAYEAARGLFDRLRNCSPIHRMGIYTSKVSPRDHYQYQLFNRGLHNKYSKPDTAVDGIGKRYGEDCMQGAVFVENRILHMSDGIDRVKRTGVMKAAQRTGFFGRLSGSSSLSYGIPRRSNWGR